MLFVSAKRKHGRLLVVMVVVEGERGHGMLPFLTSSDGGWGDGQEKYLASSGGRG